MTINEISEFEEMQAEVYGGRTVDWDAIFATEANLEEKTEVAR